MKQFQTLKDLKFVNQGIKRQLGEGAYATVKLAQHVQDDSVFYAVKQLEKTNSKEIKYIKEEIELHKSLDHKNIIKFVDYVEDEQYFYLILEYAENGDLFKTFKNKNLSDLELLKIFHQTCLGIQYLHQKNIMHRDLKPDNVLLSKDFTAKVCDFGWSCQWNQNYNRQSLCGTFEYVAPEIFKGKNQTKATDIWSLGILMYQLFMKGIPFKNINLVNYEKVFKKGVFYPSYLNKKISKFLKQILVLDPEKRLNIEQILKNEIFEELNNQNFSSKLTTDQQFQNAIKKMNKKFNFKKKKENVIQEQQKQVLNLYEIRLNQYKKQAEKIQQNYAEHFTNQTKQSPKNLVAPQQNKTKFQDTREKNDINFKSERTIQIKQKKKKYSLLQADLEHYSTNNSNRSSFFTPISDQHNIQNIYDTHQEQNQAVLRVNQSKTNLQNIRQIYQKNETFLQQNIKQSKRQNVMRQMKAQQIIDIRDKNLKIESSNFNSLYKNFDNSRSFYSSNKNLVYTKSKKTSNRIIKIKI